MGGRRSIVVVRVGSVYVVMTGRQCVPLFTEFIDLSKKFCLSM